jgi:hypothetical protein
MLCKVSCTSFISGRLAPSTAKSVGRPRPATNRLRLTPRLARSVGFFPVFFPPEGRLGQTPVHAQPGPIDPFPALLSQQAYGPHLLKHPSSYPLLEAIMGVGAGTETRGIQRLPLTAGAQDKENRLQTPPIRRARPPATEGMGVHMRRKQFRDRLPQILRDGPFLNNGQFRGMQGIRVATLPGCITQT